MASNRLTPRLVRLAVVTSVAAFSVSVLPGTAQATPGGQPVTTPTTSQGAAAKVEQLANQLEILAEDVNVSRIKLESSKKAATKAQAGAKVADQKYAKLSGEVSAIVRTTYMAAPFGQFTTLMTSSSPEDFLAQLSTLERMSEQRGKTIGAALRAKQTADAANTVAKTALGKAQSEFSALTKKQQSLNGQIKTYKDLFNRLSARERQSLVGVGGTAGRSAPRQTAPTDLPPAPNPKAQTAVQTALDQLGKPYNWGSAGPDMFDCSGLTMYAWAAAGVQLPHSSADQIHYGTNVATDVAVLKPGDLLFFYSPTIHHVAMYIGNGQMVHAPQDNVPVQVVGVDWKNIVGATRL